jgi:hypothetical protein
MEWFDMAIGNLPAAALKWANVDGGVLDGGCEAWQLSLQSDTRVAGQLWNSF